MGDREQEDTTGAYAPLVDDTATEPPEEYQNPAGIGRGGCDTDTVAEQDESCDIEQTAQVDDFVMEETKPGIGILGFEGEEDGGS